MKKRILYLSQMYPYPPDGGGKIKTFNTLQALAKKYSIYAIFISEVNPTAYEIKQLEKLGIKIKVFYSDQVLASVKDDLFNLFWHFIRGIPHYVFQYTHEPAFKFILRTIEEYKPDTIHIDHLNIAQYLPQKKCGAWILEHHNVESYLYWTRFLHSRKLTRKIYLLIEMVLTYCFEYRTLRKFDHIFAISETEAKRTKRLFGTQHVTAQPMVYPATKRKYIQQKRFYILFIGNLGWPPNEDAIEWFLRSIFPHIKKKFPDVEFHVVGRRQPMYEKNWPKLKRVYLHGYKKDLTQYLNRADVFIMPFRMGGGMRLKSLTALASRIPLVSTTLGVEGLHTNPGSEYLLARTSTEFANQVIKLLSSKKLQQQLGKNAINYVKNYHSIKQNIKFLKEYKQIIKKFS